MPRVSTLPSESSNSYVYRKAMFRFDRAPRYQLACTCRPNFPLQNFASTSACRSSRASLEAVFGPRRVSSAWASATVRPSKLIHPRRWVQREARPISLRQLTFFGRTLTESRLIDSANYCRLELPTRYHGVSYAGNSYSSCPGLLTDFVISRPCHMSSSRTLILPMSTSHTFAPLSAFVASPRYARWKTTRNIARCWRRP